VAGGREVLLYTTIFGSIGLMIPFPSVEDVDLFEKIEHAMRQETQPLSGRDHAAYRSFYLPLKKVVDGSLVELYPSLPEDRKLSIAEDMERTVTELVRQIEMLRARVS
jgi:splicing factor 3B subunit 3